MRKGGGGSIFVVFDEIYRNFYNSKTLYDITKYKGKKSLSLENE